MNRALRAVEQKLGYRFKSSALLIDALTHHSFASEDLTGKARSFGRLAFFGDAVLELIVRERLFADKPDADEGALTVEKRHFTDEESLARWARRLGLGRYLRLGRGEEKTHGRTKPSILASVFEAIVGAIYLDADLAAAEKFVSQFMGRRKPGPVMDAKSQLQIRLPRARIAYQTVGVGPAREHRFRAAVAIDGRVAGRGEGHAKKEAEQAAAAVALESLDRKPVRRRRRRRHARRD